MAGGVVLAVLRSALAGLLALNVLQHHIREQDVARVPGSSSAASSTVPPSH